ncbi:TetR/AcrR family transcriptional regulator [Paracrocinitomix mangrovi]|uniref:TetR/AcrR family transcriptional regulator n=1 Tax=Paracrocinitomix mangrovi TaxID=2862509 RepID=UPI001C8D8FEE|nr:TetR/AcrR family transcriptional regulator [Paracrocinitomix mangrovi]UKN01722.1 TetR/AcrR family transcriptional regulator [Paracrocinitomix mangrovi]
MSPRTTEQFEQIRNERSQEILDAALKVFAEDGYHAASISKIAKKAGISKGLLYNYFNSKEEVLKQLLSTLFKEVVETMQLEDINLTDTTMSKFIDDTFDILDKKRSYWKLYFSMVSQKEVNEVSRDVMLPKIMPFIEKMITYFAAKEHEDPASYMRYFMASMDGAKMQYLFDPNNFPIEKVKYYIKQEFINP